jgi:hypothetical protein
MSAGPDLSSTALAGLDPCLEDLESRLVWIWGSPRSGSSWLLDQLAHPAHPNVRARSGISLLPGESPPAGGCEVLPVDEPFIANHLAPAFADPLERDGRLEAATLNRELAASGSYAFSDRHAEAWQMGYRELALGHLQGMIERAVAQGLQVSTAPILAIKEGNGSHASDLVMQLLPQSRLLLLARDGRDVVDSLLAAYSPGGFLARNQGVAVTTREERRAKIDWAARMWACNMDTTLRAVERHPPELTRIVRYEELLAEPVGTLASLFKWMGIERSASEIERLAGAHSFHAVPAKRRGEGRRARSAKPGRWRESFSRAEQDAIHALISAPLRRLGYES